MKPNLSILPKPQHALFAELKDTPSHFILYGGTAIALQLGHRVSVDFDFFSEQPFEADELYTQIPYLQGAEIIQQENDTLTCLVDRDGPVKVSFFGGLSLASICEPKLIEGPQIKIASLIDLAGMKAAVVQKRATERDYIDLYALMVQGHVDLVTALAAGSMIYGTQFSPQITLKALIYFEDNKLKNLPQEVKNFLTKAVNSINLEKIPIRIAELQKMREDKAC